MKLKSSKQFEYFGVPRIAYTSGRTARFAVLSYRGPAIIRELKLRDLTKRSHTATELAFVPMATLVVSAFGVSMDSTKVDKYASNELKTGRSCTFLCLP